MGEESLVSVLGSVAVSLCEEDCDKVDGMLEVKAQGVGEVVVSLGSGIDVAFDAEEAMCTLSGVALSPTHTVQ